MGQPTDLVLCEPLHSQNLVQEVCGLQTHDALDRTLLSSSVRLFLRAVQDAQQELEEGPALGACWAQAGLPQELEDMRPLFAVLQEDVKEDMQLWSRVTRLPLWRNSSYR